MVIAFVRLLNKGDCDIFIYDPFAKGFAVSVQFILFLLTLYG